MNIATRPGNGRTTIVEQKPQQDATSLLDQVLEATAQARYSVQEVELMAQKVAKSNLYGMSDAQAFALMMLAEADGLHPIQAVRRWHLMQFKDRATGVVRVTTVMKAEAMLADMMRRGWTHKWVTDNRDRQKQEIWLQHPKKCPDGKSIHYDEQDANAAGLLNGANATNWERHRPDMLRARAMSNACRMLDPGVVLGVYTPEEVADMRAEEGGSPETTESGQAQLATTLAAAKRKPAAPPEESTPAPKSDQRAWLDAEVERFNAVWQDICLDHKTSSGKGLTSYQVLNGVVSAWIKTGELTPDDVNNVEGKRDKAKVGAQVKSAWEHDQQGFMDDVTDYLQGKFAELTKEAGIELAAPEGSAEPEAPDRGDAYEEPE